MFSGAGGTSTYFRDLISSDVNSVFEYCALFYGIDELDLDLLNFCKRNHIDYKFIKKDIGFSISDYINIYKLLGYFKAHFLINHILTLTPAIWWYSKNNHNSRFICVEHTNHDAKTLKDKLSSYFSYIISKRTIFFFEGQQETLGFLPKIFKGRIHIIPKGINVSAFKSPITDTFSDSSSNIKLGMHCRLIDAKDLFVLLNAFKKFLDNDLHSNVCLFIAGDGPLRKELEDYIALNNLDDYVKLLGFINSEKVYDFLSSLDIYVHTTKGETVCYSIMEAQVIGLPVISSDVSGVGTVLQNEKDALLYEKSNVLDLEQKLTKLINDKSLRNTLGERSLWLAKNRFSGEIMFENYKILIDKILGNNVDEE